MTGNSKQARDLLEAACAVCDVPVSFRTKLEDRNLSRAHGYYSFDTGEIVVDGSAALDQKAKTLIHEWAHSRLHGKEDGKSRQQREIEADSTAYVVSRYFGLDTSSYSFEYVASWASGMDAKELKSILDGIHNNADEMICAIDEMYEKVREKNRDFAIGAEIEEEAQAETEADAVSEAEAAKRSLLLQAMEAAGYWYDEKSSSDEELRFTDSYGQALYVDGWQELQEWLEGVVFDDPEVSDRVEKILHPERFPGQQVGPAADPIERSENGLSEIKGNESLDKAQKQDTAAQPPRIEDFGEKIGGARKDIWKARGLAASDLGGMNDVERASYVKKDSVWPRPDYRELEKSGIPRSVCYFIKTVRDRVPTRPSVPKKNPAREQERYINFVSAIRDAVMACRTTEDIREISSFFLEKGFCRKNSDSVFAPFEPTEKAGRYLDNKLFFAMRGGIDLEKLEADMAKKEFLMSEKEKILNGYRFVPLDGKSASVRDQGRCAILYRQGGFTYAYPGQGVKLESAKPWEWLVIKGNSILAAGLPDKDACVRYVLDEDKKAKEAAKAASRGGEGRQDEDRNGKGKTRRRSFVPPQLQHIERAGEDYRKGEDISGQAYLDDFGFRGGEFGNWTSQADRQVSLNMGYDALRDLAKALDISGKDISLGGKLAIAFGSRGKGAALAHYEPMREVINLTKMKGAGSLGHEWIHAMDDYIGKSLGIERGGAGSFLSEAAPSRYGDRIPESFTKLMDALRFSTRTGEEMVRDTRENLDKTCEIFRRNLDRITTAWNAPEQEEKRQALIDAVIEEAKISYGYQAVSYNSKGKAVHDKTPSPAYKALIDFQAGQGDDNPDNMRNRAWANIQRSAIGRASDMLDNHPDQLRKRRVQSDYYKDAAFIGANYSRSGPGYWTSGCELLARAGAAYIKDKCEALGIRNDYLSGHADAYPLMDDDGHPHYISPQGKEREAINQAFDFYFEELKENGLFHASEESRGQKAAQMAPVSFSETVRRSEEAGRQDLNALYANNHDVNEPHANSPNTDAKNKGAMDTGLRDPGGWEKQAMSVSSEKGAGMDLRNFLQDGEMVVEFATTESPVFNTGAVTSQMIASSTIPIDRQDIAGWLEETLHRLKDAGVSDKAIESMTGMKRDEDIPDVEDSISIDLGYSIPGQLLWMEPAAGKTLDDVIAGAEEKAAACSKDSVALQLIRDGQDRQMQCALPEF